MRTKTTMDSTKRAALGTLMIVLEEDEAKSSRPLSRREVANGDNRYAAIGCAYFKRVADRVFDDNAAAIRTKATDLVGGGAQQRIEIIRRLRYRLAISGP